MFSGTCPHHSNEFISQLRLIISGYEDGLSCTSGDILYEYATIVETTLEFRKDPFSMGVYVSPITFRPPLTESLQSRYYSTAFNVYVVWPFRYHTIVSH